MKIPFRVPAAAGAAALALAGVAIVGVAPAAYAGTDGTLTFSPKYGTSTSPITVNTSGPCSNASATNLVVKVSGAGIQPATENINGNSAVSSYGTNAAGGYTIPLGSTLADFAAAQSPPATLSGTYVFTVVCRTAFNGTDLGNFDGSLYFTNSSTWQEIDPAGAPIATSVSVNAGSPASPQQAGVAVTFTATVAGSGGQYPGMVQFRDGATAVGSPVAINTANGQAAFTTSSLAVGTHQINAIFTPSKAPFTTSPASANSTYVINPAPAQNTVTSLSVNPASGTADQYTNVTLTASVSPAGAGGTITFKDGATTINTRSLAPGGTAVLTQTFASGPHSFTAEFAPSDATAYNPSTSSAIAYTVNAFAGSAVQQQINVTVDAGSLVISNDQDAVVNLPTPVLSSDGRYFFTTGSIDDITVTDTRAGNPGWNATGVVSNFVKGADSFSGAQLGWVPGPAVADPGQTVVLGGTVAPNASSHGGAASTGLSVSRTLASAADDEGNGSVGLDATLNLNVPTTVPAGTYTATLTLTAI